MAQGAAEPGTLTDPQSLPAGSYDLKVVKAGDGESGDAIVEANNVEVPGGANITVVAHLDEDGDAALTPFVNDTDTLEAGEARVTARHTAAAPHHRVEVVAGSGMRPHTERAPEVSEIVRAFLREKRLT